VLRFDEHLWERELSNLKYPPVIFTREQMCFIEAILPEVCERGHWKHIADAAGPDHIHNVLTSEQNPETIRRLLKRWIGQALTERWPRGRDESPLWWAECGSIRWIADDDYLANATGYVTRQRATR
jgi:REP element-mobilizing transposase RayT